MFSQCEQVFCFFVLKVECSVSLPGITNHKRGCIRAPAVKVTPSGVPGPVGLTYQACPGFWWDAFPLAWQSAVGQICGRLYPGAHSVEGAAPGVLVGTGPTRSPPVGRKKNSQSSSPEFPSAGAAPHPPHVLMGIVRSLNPGGGK